MSRTGAAYNRRLGGRADLIAKAKEKGVDVFGFLLDVIKGDWKALGYESETDTKYVAGGFTNEERIITLETRLAAAREAASYIHTKLRSVEITGEDGGPVQTIGADLSKLTIDELKIIDKAFGRDEPKTDNQT